MGIFAVTDQGFVWRCLARVWLHHRAEHRASASVCPVPVFRARASYSWSWRRRGGVGMGTYMCGEKQSTDVFGLEGVVSHLCGLPSRGINLRLGVILSGWFKFSWRWLGPNFSLAFMSFNDHFFGLSLLPGSEFGFISKLLKIHIYSYFSIKL